jgi:peptide chain release factor 3
MTSSPATSDEFRAHVALRRTFAIISHPDAGKTTLTEKILLYAGAIELAGAVRGRKSRRHAVSDWMAMEQERGISLTSTALEFDLDGKRITLLDTPGHKDFSEDTYRSLVAADSVVMVLDSAKGVEEQTRKLFQVCKRHRLPILTFVNKCDTEGRDPLALLDEIESVLGISAAPLNWPIGRGAHFRGVYDLTRKEVLLYEKHLQGQRRAPVTVSDHTDPELKELAGDYAYNEFLDGINIVATAGTVYDHSEYLNGRQTGVFFGSAINNFGLEPFLEGLVKLAPPPSPRMTQDGDGVDPAATDFSGFVFKIQANMDPRHRDHVAFVRVCSGQLLKDMTVINGRLNAPVRVSRPYKIFGRERETSVESYAGDIVGLVNPGRFMIGDSLYTGRPVTFPRVPQFAAEHFARLRLDGQRHKQFDDGVRQLEEEGLMQVFRAKVGRDPIVGVVGALQFDVIQSRLKTEYGVASKIEVMNYHAARWVDPPDTDVQKLKGLGVSVLDVNDRLDRSVLLFPTEWSLQYVERENPGVKFLSEIDR